MHKVGIQAFAIGNLLGVQHLLAQLISIHEHLLTVVQNALLKAEAGVNIDDDLGSILQLGLNQCQLFLLVGSLADGGSHDHALVEG